jgi:PAS domain S-box-containing protein
VSELDGADRHGSADAETVAGTAASLLTFENAPLPLGVILPVGRILMANRAMRSLLDYPLGALAGLSLHDVVVADPDDLSRAWEDRVKNGERVTPELRMHLRAANGSVIAVRAASVLVTDLNGAVRYVVGRATPVRA